MQSSIHNLTSTYYFLFNFSNVSVLTFKDQTPVDLLTNVVYLFKCSKCEATYVGEITRCLHTRIDFHKSVSFRTHSSEIFCCKGNTFIFNDKFYKQTDGAPIGTCVSPTLVENFMSHNETLWLSNYPSDFNLVLYIRYVDDAFLLFRSESHIRLLLETI